MTNLFKNQTLTFAAKWSAAFLGFPLGGLAGMAVVGSVDNPLKGLVGGAFTGAVLGAAHWLAARQTKAINWRWIPATAAGLGVGLGLATALLGTGNSVPEIIARAPITGLVLGLAQWFVLQREVRGAGWWIPTITVAYTIGWSITQAVIKENVSQGFTSFGASGAIVYQALTGLVLYFLLRSTLPKEANS